MDINSVFENKGKIPVKYSCDGENVSPPLEITEISQEAKSLVIIMEDPDAPSRVFTHWMVWNILNNGDKLHVGEGENPGIQGMNDSGKASYVGPCPPSGVHRYYFKVYALNIEIDLEEGSDREDLEDEMLGHVIDSAQLMGVYQRSNI